MKHIISSLFMILFFGTVMACSCSTPEPLEEFQSASYVFEGVIVSKTYAEDYQTYTITFDISRHYKNSNNPKTLKFTFKSESQYTRVETSCDWNANTGERWLVYAKIYENSLTYGYHCSNSKPLDKRSIYKTEQRILDNANDFKLENYIYDYQRGFNYPLPISNIDSIFRLGKTKDYNKTYTSLVLYIDNKGRLKNLTTSYNLRPVYDTIYYQMTDFRVSERRKLSEFEKDALALISNVSKWEIKRHKKTNLPVKYFKHVIVSFNKEKMQWQYEL